MFDNQVVEAALLKATNAINKVLNAQYKDLVSEIQDAMKNTGSTITLILEASATGDFDEVVILLSSDGVNARLTSINEDELQFVNRVYGPACERAVERIFQILDFINLPNTAIPGTRIEVNGKAKTVTLGSLVKTFTPP